MKRKARPTREKKEEEERGKEGKREREREREREGIAYESIQQWSYAVVGT